MKRALVRADGFITDIVEAGEEFEIYTGPGAAMKWMDIPADATNMWKLELGEWIPDFVFHDPETLRIVAYGDPGSQLSMIYRDIENGSLNKDGEFYKHVKNVKETLPKVEYEKQIIKNDQTGEDEEVDVKVVPNHSLMMNLCLHGGHQIKCLMKFKKNFQSVSTHPKKNKLLMLD